MWDVNVDMEMSYTSYVEVDCGNRLSTQGPAVV